MSPRNAEIVEQGYEALNREGLDGVLRFMDEAIELVPIPAGLPDPEHFHGHDGVRAWFEKIGEVFTIDRWTPKECVDVGDRLIAAVSVAGRFKATGIPGELTYFQVWTLRDGKALRVESYLDRAQALKAAGVSATE